MIVVAFVCARVCGQGYERIAHGVGTDFDQMHVYEVSLMHWRVCLCRCTTAWQQRLRPTLAFSLSRCQVSLRKALFRPSFPVRQLSVAVKRCATTAHCSAVI